ncbi:hypothetical protein [Aquibacillus halophilus]|uniref:hypothetical protein n=1 Tax=Aquibacillus halophilus TaxID=930132 RepID=UPI00147843AC|nr:hypothetical protein [Aquibacillus halophilus]
MEKAMLQSRGVGFAEYSRKLTKRLKIEKDREADYQKSLEIAKEMEKKAHK